VKHARLFTCVCSLVLTFTFACIAFAYEGGRDGNGISTSDTDRETQPMRAAIV
jgi:hypothetical protein